MRKICLLLLLASSASGLLTSCTTEEPWPPLSEEVTSAFHDSREEFTELENKLLESKYFEVLLVGGSTAYGRYIEADVFEEEKIESDGHYWAKLLIATKMAGVYLIKDGTAFPTGLNPFVTDGYTELEIFGELIVVHSEKLLVAADSCDDSHRLLPDGECYLPLGDSWGALYSWTTM